MPKSADSWGRPYGSSRDRRRVWTGTVTILLGVTVAAVAVVLLDQVWLWIAAAVLVILGGVVLAIGRPRSTSRGPG